MPQLKKILVAYDGSPQSKEALNWAIDLSRLSGAEILAVKVFEISVLYAMPEIGGAGYVAALDIMRREDQRLMAEIVAIGHTKGAKVTGKILQGNVAGQIISYAEKNNFDIIIAGTKGHNTLEGLLMGSVTRNLVSLSHIPVLVVKD
jgi:nucleotide-binding universal stress UspA family protein